MVRIVTTTRYGVSMPATIAVLIPCYNEQATIVKVVKDFQTALPRARIYVFDNNSSDNTKHLAKEAGAIVASEHRQGKGNVVRAMFRSIEADFYVLVDGDDTYPAAEAGKLLEPVKNGQADMSVGDRLSSKTYDKANNRRFHSFGNRLVRWLINKLFRSNLTDIMSGYRVFNRFMVKTFPVMSAGFEIETELSLHALDKRFAIAEIPIAYKDRPLGSVSKLNTYRDGIKVLKTIAMVFKNYKPLMFFTACSLSVALLGLVVGIFPILEYFKYTYVFKVPSAILAAALEMVAMLLFACGVILDTIVTQHKEAYECYLLAYCDRHGTKHH